MQQTQGLRMRGGSSRQKGIRYMCSQKEEPAQGGAGGFGWISYESRALCVGDGGAALGLALGAVGETAEELGELVDGGRDLAVLLVDNCAAACHGVDVLLHFGSSSTGLRPCGPHARLPFFRWLYYDTRNKI